MLNAGYKKEALVCEKTGKEGQQKYEMEKA